jgi:SNF2 family DNA or RNA helicase
MTSRRTTAPRRPSKPSSAPSPPASPRPQRSEPQAWEPEPYQLDAARFLVQQGSSALLLDPGLRKTSIVLAAVSVLIRKGLVRRVVVLAPPRVCRKVWPDEGRKWKDFNHLRIAVVHGDNKEEILARDADIYCVSHNSVQWLFGVTKTVSERTGKVKVSLDPRMLKELGADMLVVDELGKFRSTQSLGFKTLREGRELFNRIVGLTGDPSPRDLEDLFGVMYVVDGGYSLGPYITHYRREFFYQTGYGGYTYELKPGAEDLIRKRVAPFVYRLGERDVLKLPELLQDEIRVELPEQARAAYDEMERHLLLEMEEGGVFRAANKGAALGKCHQIANGGLYRTLLVDADGRLPKGPREWVHMHDAKTDALSDLLDELGDKQILIGYHYGHDLARLLKLLGKGAPYLGSGVGGRAADEAIDGWNSGRIRRLLVHPASAGHGLNLQEGSASHVCLYSLIDDYELWNQLVRRVRRSGNKAKAVTLHSIVAEDTVDEAIIIRTDRKGRRQGSFLEGLRDYTVAKRPALRRLFRKA